MCMYYTYIYIYMLISFSNLLSVLLSFSNPVLPPVPNLYPVVVWDSGGAVVLVFCSCSTRIQVSRMECAEFLKRTRCAADREIGLEPK